MYALHCFDNISILFLVFIFSLTLFYLDILLFYVYICKMAIAGVEHAAWRAARGCEEFAVNVDHWFPGHWCTAFAIIGNCAKVEGDDVVVAIG